MYSYKTNEVHTKVVSAGIKQGLLTNSNFETLVSGKELVLTQDKFISNWKNLSVSIINQSHTVNEPLIIPSIDSLNETLFMLSIFIF